MKQTLGATLIGTAVFFQQAAMTEPVEAQSYQEQMDNIIEMHAGPDPLQQYLYVAIWNDDVDRVTRALNAGAVPNAAMVEMAIRDSSFFIDEYPGEPIVQIYHMVTHDTYLSRLTADELSEALYAAASPGHVHAIERLVENGADPNQIFPNYSTKLPAAAAASNMLFQIEQGSEKTAMLSRRAMQAFIDAGLTAETVLQNVRRDDVKDVLLQAIEQKQSTANLAPVLILE